MRSEDVKYIIIHCTKTKPESDIKDVDLLHRREGRLGCGYHFVVMQDGTIQNARPLAEPGNHAKGFNDCSIGIGLVGGRRGKQGCNNFTPVQIASLHCLVNTLSLMFKTAKAIAHSDLDRKVKACPVLEVKLKVE